jgi:hypothetical protein
LRLYRNTPSASTPCAATKARDKPTNTGTTLLPSLRSRSPRKPKKGVDLRRKRQTPPQHVREPRPPVEVHRKHRKQRNKRGEGGAKTRPAARSSATRRSSRPGRRTTPQQQCREKKGDHHSPMKHSKRRMLGAMVKAGGTPPSAQGRPPGALPRRGKQQEERARRTEMRGEPAPIQCRDVTQSRQPHETDEMSGTAMG